MNVGVHVSGGLSVSQWLGFGGNDNKSLEDDDDSMTARILEKDNGRQGAE